MPGLLVHVCCAPCAVYPLTELLSRSLAVSGAQASKDLKGCQALQASQALRAFQENQDSKQVQAPQASFSPLVAWFYNPNIHPREEHHRRRDAVAYLASRIGDLVEGASIEVDFSPPYEPEVFLEAAASDPKAPARCLACYALRLRAAAKAASRLGLESFTTTLLYSRRQKHELVAEAGRKAANDSAVSFHYEDFRSGWNKGIELGKRLELYRQRWCGCVYEGT